MPTRRAFSLLELATALAAAAVIACVLAPTMAQTQSAHRLSSCAGLLRQLGQGMQSYTTDNSNRLPTFSWRVGNTPATPGSPAAGMFAGNDLDASHMQAREIIWRRAGGFDIGDQGGWIPNIYYNHLVLIDYLGWDLRTRPLFCNEDRHRFRWLAGRQQFLNGTYSTPPYPTLLSPRWPFSSSFDYVPQTWSADGGATALSQGPTHQSWSVPSLSPLSRRISEVRYPANKVFMYDSLARHMPERWYFYAYTESRQPLLFFDLSVREKRTGSGNRGFSPTSPTSPSTTAITYQPGLPPNNWEAPTIAGGTADFFQAAYYRFTRSGLRGRDFDGPEVPWGQ